VLAVAALVPAAASAGVVHSSISSNFNGTSIAAGNWIWFNSNFKYTGVDAIPVTISIQNASIAFSAGGVDYLLGVPDGFVTLDPSAVVASTSFDGVGNAWMTTVPAGFGDDIFLTGLAFQVPVDFPGGISPVVWSGDFGTTVQPASISWKWSAAVYTSFTDDYNLLDVQVIHDGLHAGTPKNFTDFVIGGARGGGGSNFTGSWSGTASIPFDAVPVESATWGQIKATF